MRLSALAVLAPLAPLAAADIVTLYVRCNPKCDYSHGKWINNFGVYDVDFSDGCRDPPNVPALNTLCVDWSHGRAHFYFDNQPKRCMTLSGFVWDQACYDASGGHEACYASSWGEDPCTW